MKRQAEGAPTTLNLWMSDIRSRVAEQCKLG